MENDHQEEAERRAEEAAQRAEEAERRAEDEAEAAYRAEGCSPALGGDQAWGTDDGRND